MRTGEVFLCFLFVFNCVHYTSAAGCGLNPCLITTICNGKKCVLEDNCSVRCVCDVTSTLPECANATSTTVASTLVTDVNVTTETALTSITDVTHTGCQCVHGSCHDLDNTSECVCDIGWQGDTCEIPCTLPCPVGKRCDFIPGTMFNVCIPATKIPETTTLTLTVTPTTENSSNRTYNVCDPEYILRPSTERMCGVGWPCVNGVCSTDGVRYWCDCDPGGTGQSCQNTCCKQCMHGSCYYIKEQDRDICNCYANYSGPYCETWDPPSKYPKLISYMKSEQSENPHHAAKCPYLPYLTMVWTPI